LIGKSISKYLKLWIKITQEKSIFSRCMIFLKNLIIKLSSTLSMELEILPLLLNLIVDNLVHLDCNKLNNLHKIRGLVLRILVVIQFYIQMASKFSGEKTIRNFKTDKNHKIMHGVISQLIKLIIKILPTAVL
jgi:hypothetical protein